MGNAEVIRALVIDTNEGTKMWEQQLSSILEAGHFDPDTIGDLEVLSDLSVAYTAEIGDKSFLGLDDLLIFQLFIDGFWVVQQSRSGTSSGLRDKSVSRARHYPVRSCSISSERVASMSGTTESEAYNGSGSAWSWSSSKSDRR